MGNHVESRACTLNQLIQTATPGGARVVVLLLKQVRYPALALAFFAGSVAMSFAHAQTSTSNAINVAPQATTSKSSKASATARTKSSASQFPNHLPNQTPTKLTDELSFNMKFESFLNRETPPAGVPDYSQIGAHFRTESEGRVFRGTLELGGTFATAVENYSNIYVPEAFLDLQTDNFFEAEGRGDSRARLSVGRRLEAWSQLDRNWDLGLWEPLNRFDALRPIDQGLTGAFFEAGTGRAKAILFVSPIYIPEQGGSFSLQNGKFRSSSPWFVEPTDRLILFSETTDVKYDLETPSTGSVIRHASLGALVRYGGFDDGFHAQTSYSLKPRNQFATPFEGSLNLTDTMSFAAVRISPQVIYHHLAAADIGFASTNSKGTRKFSMGISALLDSPINENPGANLTYQDLDPLLLLSPRISSGFGLGFGADMEITLSYLSSVGGGFAMRGPFASDKPIFGSRVPYKEAIAIDGRVAIGKGRRSTLTLGGRWLEELAENGSLLSADASLDFSMNGDTQDWRVSLMGDVLGSRLAPNENVGYVSRYRGNDRWMSQLRFIF